MDNTIERIPINYTFSNKKIKLINGGNIKMEEDYIFEGSNISTKIDKPLNISTAINEINKINNLDYIGNEK
jgi:hypothetical protein